MPRVFLTDFGLARDTTTGSKLTRSGTTLGTPAYMAPEQARGEVQALTAACDVWALGCVLYEMLSGGRRAFEGETAAAVVGAVVTGTLPPPVRELPTAPNRLVAACLQRDVERRPRSGGALVGDCERVLRGVAPVHGPASRRWVWGAGAAAAITLLATAGWVAWRAPSSGVTPVESSPADPRVPVLERAWRERSVNPDGVRQTLAAAHTKQPLPPLWQRRLGLLYWAAGQGERAGALWEGLVASGRPPGGAALLCALERFFRREGFRVGGPEAVRLAHRAVALETGDEQRLAQAAVAVFEGRSDEALALLAHLDRWEAALLRALLYGTVIADDHRRALAEYERALAEGIAFGFALAEAARLHYHLKENTEALAAADRALALDPQATPAMVTRTAALVALKRLDEAVDQATRALALDPGRAPLLLNRGNARLQLGQLAEALADLEAARDAGSGDRRLHYYLGQALSQLGRLDEAERELRAFVARAPQDWQGPFELARLRQRQGNPAGALECYDQALALDPEAKLARANRAILLLELGRLDESVAALNRLAQEYPEDDKVFGNRAMAWRTQGDMVAAAADLKRATDLAPQDADWWGAYGDTLYRLQRWDEALTALRRALTLAPNGRNAGLFRRLVAACERRLGQPNGR